MPDDPENAGGSRNDRGQFLPGVSGNPAGKPVGTLSIMSRIRAKFAEDSTLFEDYITEILADPAMRKVVLEQMEGKPKQNVQVEHTLPANLIDALRLANPRVIEGEYTVLPTKDPE